MIVCHCTGTSDREIRELLKKEGHQSPDDVGQRCGAGHGCRGCRAAIEELVRQATTRR